MCKLLKIAGQSLSPDYRDGDFVLVSKIPYLFGPLRPGDIVAFRHRAYGTLIKIVADVAPDGDEIHVVGTHDLSKDSRDFGHIRRCDVLGRVVWHVKKR